MTKKKIGGLFGRGLAPGAGVLTAQPEKSIER